MQKLRNWAYHKLRWSERFTKTDMVYLTKGTTLLTIGQVLTSGASFLLALLFARFVPKEVYGSYKYILSLAGLASTFSLTGLSTGVLQSVARGFHGTFLEAVRLAKRWNAVIFAIAFSAGWYYLLKGNATLGYSLFFIAITFPVIKTYEIYESYLNGTKNFRASALFRGAVDIGTIFATAIGVILTDNVVALVATNVLIQVILNRYFFNKVLLMVPPGTEPVAEPDIISFSKHLSTQNILTNIASYLDRVIIFHFLGAAEVAIYSFAIALPQQVRGLLANISLVAMPKVSQRSVRESVHMVPKRFFISLLVLIPGIVLYILLAPYLFDLLFPAYAEAVPYSRWYVLTLLIMGNLSGMILTSQKAVSEQYKLTTFASISQIILMLALIHSYGIYGVIWAIVISKFATSILSYILVRYLARSSAQ